MQSSPDNFLVLEMGCPYPCKGQAPLASIDCSWLLQYNMAIEQYTAVDSNADHYATIDFELGMVKLETVL
jgi:hypothetical protein